MVFPKEFRKLKDVSLINIQINPNADEELFLAYSHKVILFDILELEIKREFEHKVKINKTKKFTTEGNFFPTDISMDFSCEKYLVSYDNGDLVLWNQKSASSTVFVMTKQLGERRPIVKLKWVRLKGYFEGISGVIYSDNVIITLGGGLVNEANTVHLMVNNKSWSIPRTNIIDFDLISESPWKSHDNNSLYIVNKKF